MKSCQQRTSVDVKLMVFDEGHDSDDGSLSSEMNDSHDLRLSTAGSHGSSTEKAKAHVKQPALDDAVENYEANIGHGGPAMMKWNATR